jgi:ecotropic viral integration site 5 protein
MTLTTSESDNRSMDSVTSTTSTASAVKPTNESLPTSEMNLLAKLEAANKLIESDAKSLNSLQSSAHSRKSSDTSQISLNSGKAPHYFTQFCLSLISSSIPGSSSVGEEDIWQTWACIVTDWEAALKRKSPSVRELVRKGIPHHFRAIVWQLLCGASDTDKKQYAEYIKATSVCEKLIRRDIARTYPEHDFFKEKDGLGQEALFNVMKAYSLHDREVGYCQGSGFIVGLLLMQMPEEEVFAVLVQIMQQHRMRDMFKPTMAELGLCMYQLENLVQEQIPELQVHFQSQGFQTSMYASSWFLTLYTTALNLTLSCRIMDIFLSEGMEFIFKVALALLHIGRETLLAQDMEAMLKVSTISN